MALFTPGTQIKFPGGTSNGPSKSNQVMPGTKMKLSKNSDGSFNAKKLKLIKQKAQQYGG